MSASQQHRNRLNVCTAHVVTNGWTSTSESVSLNVRARRVLQFSNHRARTRPRTPKPHRAHLELWNNIFRTHCTAPDIGEPDAHTHIKWHVPEQIPLLLASGQSLSHSNGSIKSYPKSITVHFYYTWTDTNSFNCKLSGCFCAASPATFSPLPSFTSLLHTDGMVSSTFSYMFECSQTDSHSHTFINICFLHWWIDMFMVQHSVSLWQNGTRLMSDSNTNTYDDDARARRRESERNINVNACLGLFNISISNRQLNMATYHQCATDEWNNEMK